MNNKGFAITTLLYGLSILGLLLILVLMSTVTSNRHNTKEIVKEIDEDLSRFSVSQASITSTDPNKEKAYSIGAGHGGWYKIELWSAQKGDVLGSYKAVTLNIPEYTTIYFYIGDSTTPDTMACLAPGGRNGCTSNNTILTTVNSGTSVSWPSTTAELSQVTQEEVEDPPGSGNMVQVTVHIKFSELHNRIFFNNTNASTGRARITQASEGEMPSDANAKDPTALKGNYYIISKDTDNGTDSRWVALTASDDKDTPVTANTFAGSKNQTWTISPSPDNSSYYSIVNVGTGRALASTTEGNYGHSIYSNNTYVTNNDFKTQDWVLEKKSTTSLNCNNAQDCNSAQGFIDSSFDFYLRPFVQPASESSLDDILQAHCGYTTPNSRFCIGKNAHHDTETSTCIEDNKFRGDISLNFNCQNLIFVNAEL